jgi:hypothetical protein
MLVALIAGKIVSLLAHDAPEPSSPDACNTSLKKHSWEREWTQMRVYSQRLKSPKEKA